MRRHLLSETFDSCSDYHVILIKETSNTCESFLCHYNTGKASLIADAGHRNAKVSAAGRDNAVRGAGVRIVQAYKILVHLCALYFIPHTF
jgi:hypothetical protein